MLLVTSLLMIKIWDLGWQKTTYKFKKVCEEILRRFRRYSSANKDIPFKTPPFFYLHCNYAIFCITTTLKQHENTGNNDQLVKWKSFNEISIIRCMIRTRYYFYFEWILLLICYGCSVHFTYCAPLFRREFRRKRVFLLEFYFKFISILHRVNN